jgi:hypothetical protein
MEQPVVECGNGGQRAVAGGSSELQQLKAGRGSDVGLDSGGRRRRW